MNCTDGFKSFYHNNNIFILRLQRTAKVKYKSTYSILFYTKKNRNVKKDATNVKDNSVFSKLTEIVPHNKCWRFSKIAGRYLL